MALNLEIESRKECKEQLYFYQADGTSRLAVEVENRQRKQILRGGRKNTKIFMHFNAASLRLSLVPTQRQVLVLVVSKIPRC